ncbi:MAG: DUF3800 domain-containing protein [Candidatus Eremiobacteraeota bacterium]|nr:DUF3800 domain-containing protein [Candidatus Eremiobacteraeota bacterium]
MNICYFDESGTPETPGTSSHFVLAGFSVPIDRWRLADRSVTDILDNFELHDAELHTAWILRQYIEQRKIPIFEKLSAENRRAAVLRERASILLSLRDRNHHSAYRQTKKNFSQTDAYIHLTFEERQAVVREIAQCIAGWSFARLFAECIDKLHFDSALTQRTVGEQAFEQVVSRFEQYLVNTSQESYGLIVHDNNDTVARKHTSMMRDFHRSGTLWTDILRISETPLFVDSKLTRMVQIADLCSYALRRYVEKQETDLFQTIYERADRVPGGRVVGVRHFTASSCRCMICRDHRP